MPIDDERNRAPEGAAMPSTGARVAIIFGPRTRIAAALIGLPEFAPDVLILVARHSVDQEVLARSYPKAITLQLGDLPGDLPPAGQMTIYCCAAGPIHPTQATADAIPNALQDLHALSQTIEHYRGAEVRIVLVSSILVLVPRRSRAIYGGWKLLLEGLLTDVVAHQPNATLCVLYPGRIVEKVSFANAISMLYTRYQSLAKLICRLGTAKTNNRCIVGADARLWLFAKRAIGAVSAILGRV